MEFRDLGTTSTKVSAIGIGTNGIGGITSHALGGRDAKDISKDEEWVRLLRLGIDLGMTFIDTAERHAAGHCEEIIGRAMKGMRDKAFVATKFSPEDNSYEGVLKAANRSLVRLDTSYIDLFQIHWPNPNVPLDQTMRALKTLINEEKVKYTGLCNFSIRETRAAMSYIDPEHFVSISHGYNLLERTPAEQLIHFSKENKLTFVAYTPFLYGMMTAKNDQRMKSLSEISKRNNISVPQLVLNWVIREPNVITIPKTSNEAHLKDNASALDIKVNSEDLAIISELFEPRIQNIPTDSIKVRQVSSDGSNRTLYSTVGEAIENRLNIIPSSVALSKQIIEGDEFKPVKVQRVESKDGTSYILEGKPPVVVRYWAWVIAHKGKLPIPAVIHDES
jgi:aryl-alcohol dehydrogenase-like predicted oxidoreductase